MSRTELHDLAPVGEELDESILHGISGGRSRVIVTMGPTQIDPPGVCVED